MATKISSFSIPSSHLHSLNPPPTPKTIIFLKKQQQNIEIQNLNPL